MAVVYGKNMVDVRTVPPMLSEAGKVAGNVKVKCESYTSAGGQSEYPQLSAGDVVQMFRINSSEIPVGIAVIHGYAWGMSASVDIGIFDEGSADGHDGVAPPSVESIDVSPYFGTITIKATNYDTIEWVSNGKVVHKGESVDLDELPETGEYLRAMIRGTGGYPVVGTQPFYVRGVDEE